MPKEIHAKDEENKIEAFDFHPKISELISLIRTIPYLNKEIFLRELISNSNDALVNIHLKEPSTTYCSKKMCIKIKPNKNNRTLTIIDNGIGMTRADLITNLGAISKYEIDTFMKTLQTEDMPLGQFGMGFYSAFLVANKVIVISKHKDDKQYLWKSSANGFTITHDKYGERLERGTKIVLYIKEDQVQYLEESKIKEIVKRHSHNPFFSFVVYPMKLLVQKEREIELSEDETESTENENGVKKNYLITEKYTEVEELNNMEPMWMRENLNVVPTNEYYEHYKLLTHDSRSKFLANCSIITRNVKALFYVPCYIEEDGSFNPTKRNNIELYVKNVFIMNNCNELIAEYLRFMTGIVNSEDLSVNISRKMLKQGILEDIRNSLTQQCLDLFICFQEKDKEVYEIFYRQFHNHIKLGIKMDNKNRSKLMRLLRYYTSASGNEMCSLSDYVSRMKDKQEYIYYVIGISENHVANSFFVEKMKRRGFEVIYIKNNILDQSVVQMKFDEKQFKSIYKANLKPCDQSHKTS